MEKKSDLKKTIDLSRYPRLSEWIGDEERPDEGLMNLVAEDMKDAVVDLMTVYESGTGLLMLEDQEAIANAAGIMAITYRNIMRVKEELFPK